MHKNRLAAHKFGSVSKLRQEITGFAERHPTARTHMMKRHSTNRQSRPAGAAEAAVAENRIYEMQVRICKALANHTRLRILDLLGKKSYTVSGLQAELGIPLANV